MANPIGMKIYAFSESITLPALQANHNTRAMTPKEKITPLMERNATRFVTLSSLKDSEKLPYLTTFFKDELKIDHVRFNDKAIACIEPVEADVLKGLREQLNKKTPLLGALNITFGTMGLMSYHEINVKDRETSIYIVSERTPDIFNKDDITLILTPHIVKDLKDMSRTFQLPPEVLAFATLLQVERIGSIPGQIDADKTLGFNFFDGKKNALEFWFKGCTMGEHGRKVGMQFMKDLSEKYTKVIRDGRIEDELTDVSLMVARAIRKVDTQDIPAEVKRTDAPAETKAARESSNTNVIAGFMADEQFSFPIREQIKELFMEQQKKDVNELKALMREKFKNMSTVEQGDLFYAFFKLFERFSPTTTCEFEGIQIRFRNLITIQRIFVTIEKETKGTNIGTPESASQAVKDTPKLAAESPKRSMAETNTQGPSETHKIVDPPQKPRRSKPVSQKTIDDLFPKGTLDDDHISLLRLLVDKFDELKEDGFVKFISSEEFIGKTFHDKEKALKFCQSVKARLVDNSTSIQWGDENDIGCKVHTIIIHLNSKSR